VRSIVACSALVLLAGCAGQGDRPNDAAVCNAFESQRSHGEVVADGTVAEVLGTRSGPSGEHEGFLLKMSGQCDLLLQVETNVDVTGPVPLHEGEAVVVKGEYEFEPVGGVIHWTHHANGGRHEGGFVEAGGKYYE
jgi:hypothetical protein